MPDKHECNDDEILNLDDDGESSSENEEEPDAGRGISVDDFCALANKFVSQQMFDEAISLYETATKMYPTSLALKINLGRIRDMQKRTHLVEKDKIKKEVVREKIESDRLSNRYYGLGKAYLSKGKIDKAVELFELSKHENSEFYMTHAGLAEIYYKQDELERACAELEISNSINPFDEDVSAFLGRIYTELAKYRDALDSYISAFLLSMLKNNTGNTDYKGKIRFLFEKLGIEDKNERQGYIKERMSSFNALVKELDEKKKEFLESTSFANITSILSGTRQIRESKSEKLKTAIYLKKFFVFKDLSDDEMFKVTRVISEKVYEPDEVICSEDTDSGFLFLLDKGKVKISKYTPVGDEVLGTLGPGDYFGEINLIDGGNHSATVTAIEKTTVWAMKNNEIADLFEMDKKIAVHFYWNFWRSLSRRTRRTNELMKNFFTDAAEHGKSVQEIEKQIGAALDAEVDVENKLQVLEDKGLSSKELRLLATFSKEQMYKPGQLIFREGDIGEQLYIILDGKVIISKFIPGVGEEALAILNKGDFFGEMALVDSSPRSADAKAHQDTGTTILSIEKRTLDEILSLEVESAYQFLQVLCRIITFRLREISGKLARWRVLSGGF